MKANRRRKVALVLLALLLLLVLLVDLLQPDSAAQPTDEPALETLVDAGAGEAEGCLFGGDCVDHVAGRDHNAASTSGRAASVRAGGVSDAGQLFDRLSPRATRFEYDANYGVACSSPELCLGGLGAGVPIPTFALSVGNTPWLEETGERLVLQGYLPREAWDRTDGAGVNDASDSDLAPGGGVGSFNSGLMAGGGFGGGGFVGGFSDGRPGSSGTPAGNGPEQQQPPARTQVLSDSGSNAGAAGGGGNSGSGNPGGGGNSAGGNSSGGNAGGGNASGGNASVSNAGGGNAGGGNASGGNAGGGNAGGGNATGGNAGGGNAGGGNSGGGSNGPNVPLDQYLEDEIGGGSGDGGGGNLFTPPNDSDDSNGGSGSSGGGGGQVVIEDLPRIGDDEEDLQVSEVPEPANLVLVGTGLAYGLLQWRRRRNRT